LGFERLAEFFNTGCRNVAGSHDVGELVVPPQFCFSAETQVQTLLELALVPGLSNNSNAVGEVVDVPIVILTVSIDDVGISLIARHV